MWRELGLGLKALARSIMDLMLVWLVVYQDMLIENPGGRIAAYIGVSVATYICSLFGIHYLIKLKQENWGQSEYQSKFTVELNHRDVRQDAREVDQAGRDVRQEERDDMQNIREISQSEREVRIDERDNGGT